MEGISSIESILCLTHNTFRLVDYTINRFIREKLDIDESESITMLKWLNAKKRNEIEELSVDEENFTKLRDSNYPYFYNNSQISDVLINTLDNLRMAKFIDNIYLLHLSDEIKEDGYINLSYSGNIEELEKIIIDNNITTIILDDIETLKILVERKKIPLANKSFMLSEIGYNFITVDDKLEFKYTDLVTDTATDEVYDVGFMKVYEFDEEENDEMMCKG